jgi:hypothetical protein
MPRRLLEQQVEKQSGCWYCRVQDAIPAAPGFSFVGASNPN